MNALEIRDLAKSFGPTPVLRRVDLDAPAGSVTAVLGPSGCGKTTLLRLIAGFLGPDSGTIAIGGTKVSDGRTLVPTERRGLGYLAQEGALFPHLTVARNITFGLPRRRRGDTHCVAELLELVSLDVAMAGRYPHELSGGQQQRVALARTLAPGPRLVLLDEPFSALDAGLRAETRAAVAAALFTAGVTTVLVTHDQAEALSFADRVAVMHDGRFAQIGSPADVYDWPADLRTARFIGDTCLLPGSVDGDMATSDLGPIPVRRRAGEAGRSGSALLMLRPEQVVVTADEPAVGGVRAVVKTVEYFGHDSVLTVDLASDPEGAGTVTARIPGSSVAVGSRVCLTVIGSALAFHEPDGLAGPTATAPLA